jgi:predicted permease
VCIYILACCPVAVVVPNFAEMLGEGQKESANTVLLGTLLCIVTLPVMLLLV